MITTLKTTQSPLEASAKIVIPVKLVPACRKRVTVIQRFCNTLKRLDSHSPLKSCGDKFRGNDKLLFSKTFARALRYTNILHTKLQGVFNSIIIDLSHYCKYLCNDYTS